MQSIDMTPHQAINDLAIYAHGYVALEHFESCVQEFREAVLNGDATAVDEAGADLVGYLYDPTIRMVVTRAVFELSRAMNESASRAVRVIVQAHQAYALESLANRVLELEQGGDDDGSDDGSAPDGDGGGSAPQPSREPLQPAA